MFLRSVIAAGALLLASCAAPEPEPQAPAAEKAQPAPAPPAADRPEPASVTAGQTEFGVELYRRLAAEPGNLFLSPAGVSMALGMVYAGAEGETAAEMAAALRYPGAGAHEGMADLLRRLPIAAEGRRLDLANALWVQQDFPLKPAFLELVRSHYGGGAQAVDFLGAPDRAIATVNRWAEEKTAGRIKQILRPENINDRTRLVLTNAVYFKADWLLPFQAAQTRPRPFKLGGGGTLSVPMMRQRANFRLLEAPAFEAVEMPYKGEELSMLLFVPKESSDLKAFERGLEGKALGDWIDRLMSAQRVDLELVVPKLELETRASLVPQLQALGMRRAFTQMAQLGGISEGRLYLSDVLHQTYLRVDEKGTEAAAVTAGLAEIVSMPRAFHADRPFFFVIRDNRSGTLLFLGRIERPSPPGS
jgi:serine protease inhibitor